jgi:hypothetical protein
MCDRVAGEIRLSLVRLANFSGTQGILIPVNRLVNDVNRPPRGFLRRRRMLSLLGAPATFCVIYVTQ